MGRDRRDRRLKLGVQLADIDHRLQAPRSELHFGVHGEHVRGAFST